MAFKKKVPKQAAKGVNILNDAEERKKFKTALATVTQYFRQIDDQKEGVKETISDLSSEYGLDAKTIRKLATIMYKHNYSSYLQEEQHFQALYEQVIEGKLHEDIPVPDED